MRAFASRAQLWTRHAAPLRLQVPGLVHRHVAASASEIDKPDVRKLAKMAHIDVTDAEVEAWGPKLAEVTDFFAQLKAIDVSGVQPSLRALADESADLREDAPVVHPMADKFLESVPQRDGDLIKVPRITTDADKAQ